jgi:HSP20 family protein
MNALKPNPFFPAKSLTGIINDVFNRNLYDLEGVEFANTIPSVNISESSDKFSIDVAAPGLQKGDFNLVVDNDQLQVSASKEQSKEQTEEGKWTRKEFNFTSFKRSFHLSEVIDTEKIQAEYIDGILKVTLPKKEEAKVKPSKVIDIK